MSLCSGAFRNITEYWSFLKKKITTRMMNVSRTDPKKSFSKVLIVFPNGASLYILLVSLFIPSFLCCSPSVKYWKTKASLAAYQSHAIYSQTLDPAPPPRLFPSTTREIVDQLVYGGNILFYFTKYRQLVGVTYSLDLWQLSWNICVNRTAVQNRLMIDTIQFL